MLRAKTLTKRALIWILQIIELFCRADDFAKRFNQTCVYKTIEHKKKKIRNRESRISLAEGFVLFID